MFFMVRIHKSEKLMNEVIKTNMIVTLLPKIMLF